jgi:hypothetical protein
MRNIQSLVYYPDSEKIIPTRGLPTSVIDMYRSSKLVKEDNNIINSGIVFHENYNDIAIFENELNSIDDILKFETSLRFLILKDFISVLEPSVRVSIKSNDASIDSYLRIPKYALDSADEIYQKSNGFNYLFPIEKIVTENGKVIESTKSNSIYFNLERSEIEKKLLEDSLSKDFLHTLPQSLSIPFITTVQNQILTQ